MVDAFRPCPVMVTLVPPAIGPYTGRTDVTTTSTAGVDDPAVVAVVVMATASVVAVFAVVSATVIIRGVVVLFVFVEVLGENGNPAGKPGVEGVVVDSVGVGGGNVKPGVVVLLPAGPVQHTNQR